MLLKRAMLTMTLTKDNARPVFVAYIVNLARWPGLPPVVPDAPA